MKKVLLVLMVLMLAGGVLAMSDPIVVKSEAGNEVKVYVRSLDGGPFLNTDKGIADADGIFEAGPFFSLNQPLVNLRILVIEGSGEPLDEKIPNYNTNTSLNIDCTGSGCETVDVAFGVTEEEVVVENETVAENETVIEDDSDAEGGLGKLIVTGKAIFTNDDGSLSLVYSIGGLVLLIAIIVFVFMMFHKGGHDGKPAMDDDEKELKDTEKKVKETEDKINSIKDKKNRSAKLEQAKIKLAEEERELRDLQNGGDVDAIAKQKDVVEKASDKVDTHQQA
jgi:hypothetical protein